MTYQFTEEESALLKELGFEVYLTFADRGKNSVMVEERRDKKQYRYREHGIYYDVDGDRGDGWTNCWYDTLEILLEREYKYEYARYQAAKGPAVTDIAEGGVRNTASEL